MVRVLEMKTTLTIRDQFDDMVGNWLECSVCKNMMFIPVRMEGKNFIRYRYCPFCGAEVESIKRIEIDIRPHHSG